MAATASARNVDFSNVKDGGNFNRRRIPAGDYLATITKVEDAPAKDETPQYLFSIKINKHPSSVMPYYCKLQENQLWKLRNIMIAAGKAVPKKRVKVDPNTIVGKMIGVTVEDDDYDGKEQSSIAGVFPAAELAELDTVVADEDDDDEDEDEADDSIDLDDEADDDEDSAPDYSGLSRVELKAEIAKHQPGFQARKSQTDDDLRQILTDLVAGGGSDDEEDEEDDEPAPAPAPKKKAAKKPVNEVTDDELEELDIDNL